MAFPFYFRAAVCYVFIVGTKMLRYDGDGDGVLEIRFDW